MRTLSSPYTAQTNTTLTHTDNNPPASLSNQRNKETHLTCTRGEIITLMYRHFLNTYPTSLDKMDKGDDFTHSPSLSLTHCLKISLGYMLSSLKLLNHAGKA